MSAPIYSLVIGTKRYSSWSLRPWLLMRQAGIAFNEEPIRLRQSDTAQQILRHSPSGKVPALKVTGGPHAGLLVWDSLAICEWIAEQHAERQLWPLAAAARAVARSAAAEMHSGFPALREHCPMDFITSFAHHPVPDNVAGDIRRIVALWRHCRSDHAMQGPFLFGAFSVADAMYAPVVSRFHSYLPSLAGYGDDGTAAAYVAQLMALPAMQAWGEDARRQETDD